MECDRVFWGFSSLLSFPHLLIGKNYGGGVYWWWLVVVVVLIVVPKLLLHPIQSSQFLWILWINVAWKASGELLCWKWSKPSVFRASTTTTTHPAGPQLELLPRVLTAHPTGPHFGLLSRVFMSADRISVSSWSTALSVRSHRARYRQLNLPKVNRF